MESPPKQESSTAVNIDDLHYVDQMIRAQWDVPYLCFPLNGILLLNLGYKMVMKEEAVYGWYPPAKSRFTKPTKPGVPYGYGRSSTVLASPTATITKINCEISKHV